LIAEGDKVVSRGSWTGPHTGPLGNIPPTGKKVTVSGIDIIRVANGKIVEHWEATDSLGLLTQLGLIPGPAASATEAAK
jgi:predicted ester cyclase